MAASGGAASTGLQPVWLIKWGGGLITDKTQPESPDLDCLDRLAAELVSGRSGEAPLVIVGHGSGSFGHWAANESFLASPASLTGGLTEKQRRAIARTADAAARLHRLVVARLLDAGESPFSWMPSTALYQPPSTEHENSELAIAGDPDALPICACSLRQSLVHGLLPVTMGDVVLSRNTGASIWSTERIFELLVATLPRAGFCVNRAIWLGNTDGVLDSSGDTLSEIGEDDYSRAERAVSGSKGTDVTGGMRLRFDTCRRLARRGVESWVLDGRVEGVLAQALQDRREGGTAFASLKSK